MECKSETENIPMMDIPHMSVPKQNLPAKDPQIQRTRQTLLFIPVICFTLSMITSIFLLILTELTTETKDIQPILQISQALISILLHAFGLFTVYRYSALGLRVFAWLYAIMMILEGIGSLLVILLTITDTKFSHFIDVQTNIVINILLVILLIIFCICFISVFIFSMIIVKLALKLARLIYVNKGLIIEQN